VADSLALSFFMPVMQNEYDEDNGYYKYRSPKWVDPVTGY
jgi:hypothetical protein